MIGKVKNPERRCRICGGKCEKQMRYCKLCAKERKTKKAIRTIDYHGTITRAQTVIDDADQMGGAKRRIESGVRK